MSNPLGRDKKAFRLLVRECLGAKVRCGKCFEWIYANTDSIDSVAKDCKDHKPIKKLPCH